MIGALKSWNFWRKHRKIVRRIEDSRHEVRSKSAVKGHETRRRRESWEVARIIDGTETRL